jgi:hypothetical protein
MTSSALGIRAISALAALAAATLANSCGLIAPAYPKFGQTPYRLEGDTAAPNGGPAVHTVIYRSGPNLRVETMLPHYGQAIVVFDQGANAAYVLNPTIQATSPTNAPVVANSGAPAAAPAAAIPRSAAPDATTSAASTPATPSHAVGVAVRIAGADAPQPLETAWAALGANNATSAGACRVAGQNGHEWRPVQDIAPGVKRTACITNDGIVLRVRENARVLFEATNVQRGPQNAHLFGVPPSYRRINPEAAAQSVSANTDQLDSAASPPRPG